MPFFIGRGFAEVQILKTWNWPHLLNLIEYIDETLHTHWYWQDLAQEIEKEIPLDGVQILKKWKLPITLEP